MSLRSALVPTNTKIAFLSYRKMAFALSLALILGTCVLLATKGLNFGIDFTGGTVVEIRTAEPVSLSSLRSLVDGVSKQEITLQQFGSENDVMIRIAGSNDDNETRVQTVNAIKQRLSEGLSVTVDYRKVDFVGPQVGQELIHDGALALVLAFLAIMAYIWIRFEWQFGLGAVIALLHDTFLTIGLFSLLGLEFNLTSIAAILTIIGYSINDSVVIYDRIRDNLRKYKKKSIQDVIDASLNETLARTILTAGTTIVALIALVALGGEVIRGFSISVLFGVVVGTYSSIYIAAPSLIFMKLSRPNSKNKAN